MIRRIIASTATLALCVGCQTNSTGWGIGAEPSSGTIELSDHEVVSFGPCVSKPGTPSLHGAGAAIGGALISGGLQALQSTLEESGKASTETSSASASFEVVDASKDKKFPDCIRNLRGDIVVNLAPSTCTSGTATVSACDGFSVKSEPDFFFEGAFLFHEARLPADGKLGHAISIRPLYVEMNKSIQPKLLSFGERQSELKISIANAMAADKSSLMTIPLGYLRPGDAVHFSSLGRNLVANDKSEESNGLSSIGQSNWAQIQATAGTNLFNAVVELTEVRDANPVAKFIGIGLEKGSEDLATALKNDLIPSAELAAKEALETESLKEKEAQLAVLTKQAAACSGFDSYKSLLSSAGSADGKTIAAYSGYVAADTAFRLAHATAKARPSITSALPTASMPTTAPGSPSYCSTSFTFP